MQSKYYKKKIKVAYPNGFDRYDPRLKKKVHVGTYPRNQRYRKYGSVSREQALKYFEQRSERAKAIDKSRTSKNVLEKPNEFWLENIGRSDVKDIDTKTSDIEELLTLKENFKGDFKKEVEDSNFGKIIMSKDKISGIIENKSFKTTDWYEHYKDGKSIDISNQNIMIHSDNQGKKYLKIGEFGYRFEDIEDSLKHLKNPQIIYKENSPLLIKGENYSMIISPFIGTREEWENYREIPYKDYKQGKWTKAEKIQKGYKRAKEKQTPKKHEPTDEMAKYLNETIEKHKKPYMEKMKQLEERIMDIERKGRDKSDFSVVLRYPQGEQKELVEQYNNLKKRVDRINSRDYELKLQKRWKTLQDLPKLKDKEKYYIVSVEGGYAQYVAHTTNKEKAIKDAEVQEIFLKKYRPDKKGKIEIIVGNDIHDVRDQLHERGREDYLITGDTYLNRKKIHGIAKVKFDYNEKGYRGKLSKEEFEELIKIPGLKIKKSTPFTKEDIEISNIEKAHSKSRKYLKHIKQEGSTWQKDKPFTKEQQSTWNSLTHFPQDWNKEFKNSVDKKEREILKRLKIQKIEDAPEDVQNAFDYYRKNSYDFIREYNRARQVAPPISVVGPAKYPTHKIPKADTIRKNASEKLKKANKTVDKIMYQYINLQPEKTAEERRQKYRENITPKLIKAKEEGKKAYSPIYDEWYNIERVNKKTITVKSKMGDYNFTIDKSFIKQIES